MKKILTDAAAVANATARAITFECRIKESYFYPNSAWGTPIHRGKPQYQQNGVRLFDPRTFFYYYATINTPAMARKMIGIGFECACAFKDAEGQRLDGAKT